MSTHANELLRPSAEDRYADELSRLAATDDAPKPPGWALSLEAVRTFVLGDDNADISRKFVGDASLIDRALVSLATSRGLMLIGEPGTASSSIWCDGSCGVRRHCARHRTR